MTAPIRYRTPTEKGYGLVLSGVGGVVGLDGVINLLQGDFIVAAVHAGLAVLTFKGGSILRGHA